MRSSIEGLAIPHPANPRGVLTISGGCCNGVAFASGTAGNWMEIWLVIRTGTGEYAVYAKGGPYATQTLVRDHVAYAAGTVPRIRRAGQVAAGLSMKPAGC